MFTKGNSLGNIERRKTSHINDSFKKFCKEELSRALGIEVSERLAQSVFRLMTKVPLKFLMTLEGEDLDGSNERSMAVPGLAKYRIMNTKPQGSKIEHFGADGVYPRYKFYPSSALESIVEAMHGVGDDEANEAWKKDKENEEKQNALNAEEIGKLFKKLEGNEEKDEKEKEVDTGEETLTKVLSNMIESKLEEKLKGLKVLKDEEGCEDISGESYEDDEEKIKGALKTAEEIGITAKPNKGETLDLDLEDLPFDKSEGSEEEGSGEDSEETPDEEVVEDNEEEKKADSFEFDFE